MTTGRCWDMTRPAPERRRTEIRPPFDRKWYRLFPEEGLMAGVQPVIADGKVFVGTMRGTLHAIDSEHGKDLVDMLGGRGDSARLCRGRGQGRLRLRRWEDQCRECGRWQAGLVRADGPGRLECAADPSRHGSDRQPGWEPLCHRHGSRDRQVEGRDRGAAAFQSGPGCRRSRAYVASEDMHVYAFDFRAGRQYGRVRSCPASASGAIIRWSRPTARSWSRRRRRLIWTRSIRS